MVVAVAWVGKSSWLLWFGAVIWGWMRESKQERAFVTTEMVICRGDFGGAALTAGITIMYSAQVRPGSIHASRKV